MKYKISLTIFTLLLFASCDEMEMQRADNNIPVVESYIHPGKEISVSIYKQLIFNSDDTTNQELDNLNVIISDGTNNYVLHNTGQGNYENPDIVVTENQEYSIQFDYNEKVVHAITRVPKKPEGLYLSSSTIEVFSFDDIVPGSGMMPDVDPVDVTWSNPDNDYHIIVVENIEPNPVLITESTDLPMLSFRITPTQGTSQELRNRNFTYYGDHRLILYKLNAEYAALYEQLGTSSLDIVAPPSNIENGLGIFTAINSDTVYITAVSVK